MSPLYAASTASLPMTCINPGDQQTVWNAESPTTGQSSQAVALSPVRFGDGPKGVSAQIVFSGAPGAFDYRLQSSDTDVDGDYIDIPGAVVTTVNAGQATRMEISTTAKYVRLNAHTQAGNAVTVTAKISRA